MEITSVIIRPRITEKCQLLKSHDNPKMAFVVNMKANKYQVANAFESLFGVKPTSVNILKRKPAPTRLMKKSKHNYSKAMKIAYVTVSSKDYTELQKKSEELSSANSEPVSESSEKIEEAIPVETIEESKE